MARLILLFLFSFFILSLFALLLSTVNIRIFKGEETVIEFRLLPFILILYPQRKGEKGKSKKKNDSLFMRLKERFDKSAATRRAIEYLLPHTDVRLWHIEAAHKPLPPDKLAIRNQNLSSLMYAFIAYVSARARSFSTNDLTLYSYSQDSSHLSFDISFKARLFYLIFSYLLYKVEIKKRKKRGFGFGTNENERNNKGVA